MRGISQEGAREGKGGSGKTTTAAHLAQRLALLGYRVLAIDLDPQASLTALNRVQPEYDLRDGGTLYVVIRYEAEYDVVVIDCLGFLIMSARSAATGVVVTIHPEILDVMSMSHDWMRYVLTRYEPTDAPQNRIVAFLRTLYGDKVLNAPMLKSTAISDAGLTKQTLYEVERSAFTRTTYDRAIESINAVNDEIAQLIQKTWGRP